MFPSLGLVPTPSSSATAAPVDRAAWTDELCRIGMWLGVYAVAALAVMNEVTDWDLWWHLRTGQWIVEHGRLPFTDPFSAHGQGRPWLAYSWLFEVLIYGLYRGLGLYGVLLYRAILAFAVLASIHRLVSRREPRFLPALGLVAAAAVAVMPVFSERPWLLTVLFTTWTLDVVLELREGRWPQRAWLLPVVFAVWANVHIQFIYGIFIILLAGVAPRLDRWWYGDRRAAEAAPGNRTADGRLGVLLVACLAATLVNPYGARIYGVILEYAVQPGPFRLISELMALTFRDIWDWAMLGLAFAAAFALGRRTRLSSFEVLLLAGTAFCAFRAKRDIWFLTVASLAILITPRRAAVAASEQFPLTRRRLLGLVLGIAVVLGLTAWQRQLSPWGLERAVEAKFPVQAAAFVREQGCAGPLYNELNWGGYLIWALPAHPVALDGRTNLHGDERIFRIEGTWRGRKDWQTDPDLRAANLVVAYTGLALTELLRRDSDWQLAYEDDIAAVFVRRGDRALSAQERNP
jgi:hypothetical protein